MSLRLCHPKLPTCESCITYRYDEDWNIKKRRRGRVGLTVIEEPEKRLDGEIPPCKTCPKIPEGSAPIPENAVTLSAENEAAFFYWQVCKRDPLERDFPRDALTRTNQALIQGVVDSIDRHRDHDRNQILLAIAKAPSL